MAQQTALETFWEQIAEILPFSVDSVTAIRLYDKLQEAKQMEREQIIAAHDNGQFWSGEQYYNETYGCKQNEDLTFKKKSQWTKIDKKQP